MYYPFDEMKKRARWRATVAEVLKHDGQAFTVVPCRSCGEPKPVKEVTSRFRVYGHWRMRFKMCRECLRRAAKAARLKRKGKL